MIIKSVDWAILGCVLFGVFLFVSVLFYEKYGDFLLFGYALGWAACSIFWTYWIQYHGKKEGSK